MHNRTTSQNVKSLAKDLPGQVVLVLQGGGALGSYQAGVYQALHEAGVEPDWINGTSIGAINASLIAGNPVEDRLPRLKEFWKRVEQNPVWNTRTAFQDSMNGCPTGRQSRTESPASSGPIRWHMPAMAIRWAPNAPAIIRPCRLRKR